MIGMFLGFVIAMAFCVPGLWLIAQGHTALGLAIVLAPSIAGTISLWHDVRRATQRQAPPRAVIAAPLRAELEQSPEWWDRQYRALIRKQIPRDAASHEGHSIAEARTYGGDLIYRTCVDCNVGIDPYEENL